MKEVRADEFGYRGFRLWREEDGFHGQRLLTGTPLPEAPLHDRGAAMNAVDTFWTTELTNDDKESR